MNPYHQPFLSQQNLLVGILAVIATASLIGKEGQLVELTRIASGANTGKLGADVPDAITDTNLYLLVEGAAAGEKVRVAPLIEGESYKIRCNGTGTATAVLCLAAVGTAADKGKLRTVPGAAGTYRQLFTAEEDFVDEQLTQVRCTRYLGNVTVS